MQIVALEPDGQVVALEPQEFSLEVDLQDLLRDYPRLLLAPLPAYQDRTIWTIGYEVPTEAGSIDLLCLDSTGEVWVVETKLAKNPESRKQVVGQVLGYASAVAEWSVDRLEAVAQEFLGEPLVGFLGDELGGGDAEDLVTRAVEKLRQGDLTALIVLDKLNLVLQRLVEFVNSHSSFDLLALTVTLTEHEGTRFVVPAVTGAGAIKLVSPTGRSKETLDELMDDASGDFLTAYENLQVWAADRGYEWSTSPTGFRLHTSDGVFILQLYPNSGSINLTLNTLMKAGMADEVDHLRNRFGGIIGKSPKIDPKVYAEKALADWDDFVEVLDLYVEGRVAAKQRLR